MLHAGTPHGNLFDDYTLNTAEDDVQAMTGIEVRRIHVNIGYGGHDYPKRFRTSISGQFRWDTPTIRKEMRRHAAVEPLIGHLKAVLTAAGYKLSLLRRWMERLLCAVLRMLAFTLVDRPTTTKPLTPRFSRTPK